MVQNHILLVTFPVQGHINPSLQFAKRLLNMGVEVTIVTSIFGHRRMLKAGAEGLNFALFSDGYDDHGFKSKNNVEGECYLSELRRLGSNAVRDVIQSGNANKGAPGPITCLVYTLLLTWAAEVAREFHIPFALLWVQPASVLDIYYCYFRDGYEDCIKNNSTDLNWKIQFPGLPAFLQIHDLPSFILPSSMNHFIVPAFKTQMDELGREESEKRPKVLVNTFDALEPEALKAIEKYDMIGIGPLIPSGTLHEGDPFQKSENYMDWLDSKPSASVIYVAFGTVLSLQKQQIKEIAKGLLQSGRSFLWVIINGKDEEKLFSIKEQLELEQKGVIVKWCSQFKVLRHPSLGCFVTHCGWNSALESMGCAVPVIAFPQWADQRTNAKLLEDVWKIAVRVRPNKDGLVQSDEIKKCIDLVMNDEDGDKLGLGLRRNAKRWMDLAREATEEGGSSDRNLKIFLQDV